MSNKDIIAKIKAEIERRIDILSKVSVEEAKKGNFDMSHYYHGKDVALEELLSFLSTLESEKPMNLDDAMKELDEKIALVKERGTWDGVDVDKYMDEVRGREPEKPMNLEEEVKRYYSENFDYISSDQPTLSILTNIARHFTDWQKEQTEKRWLEDRDGCFWDGVEEGKKVMREQMMKEAVEGYIAATNENSAVLALPRDGFKKGDKVRVIVCPKED